MQLVTRWKNVFAVKLNCYWKQSSPFSFLFIPSNNNSAVILLSFSPVFVLLELLYAWCLSRTYARRSLKCSRTRPLKSMRTDSLTAHTGHWAALDQIRPRNVPPRKKNAGIYFFTVCCVLPQLQLVGSLRQEIKKGNKKVLHPFGFEITRQCI